jgi:hypothetical protein
VLKARLHEQDSDDCVLPGTVTLRLGQRSDTEVFGETQWVTYAQFGDRLKAFCASLKALSMKSQPDADELCARAIRRCIP